MATKMQRWTRGSQGLLRCPHCRSELVYHLEREDFWRCAKCRNTFAPPWSSTAERATRGEPPRAGITHVGHETPHTFIGGSPLAKLCLALAAVAIVGIGAALGAFSASMLLDTEARDAMLTPTPTPERAPDALAAVTATPTPAPTPSPTPEPSPTAPPTSNPAEIAYEELEAQFAYAHKTIPISYEDFTVLVQAYSVEGAMRYVATGGWDSRVKVCEPWQWSRDWPS